ncbi:Fatty acid-binding protein 1 [Eumeta japonica]|uniref:Fatty acid-binding protein 1 n=1 Tax=Eumeta variegata TaxID=151549 RepID=A0A4C1XKX1_EUMVA|nr:Fatty acid-binding protein 1 [Eumeta japonica]
MADFLGKVYKCERGENAEAYMDFLGVQGDHRASYVNAQPDMKLVKNSDGTYTLDVITQSRTLSNTFQSGKEFDEQMIPGVVAGNAPVTPLRLRVYMAAVNAYFLIVHVLVCPLKNFHEKKELSWKTEREIKETEREKEIEVDLFCSFSQTTTAEGWDGKAVRYYKAA